MTGEIIVHVTPTATIGEAKIACAQQHGTPRGSQEIYLLEAEEKGEGGTGIGTGTGNLKKTGTGTGETGSGKPLLNSRIIAQLPQRSGLLMIVGGWEVRVDGRDDRILRSNQPKLLDFWGDEYDSLPATRAFEADPESATFLAQAALREDSQIKNHTARVEAGIVWPLSGESNNGWSEEARAEGTATLCHLRFGELNLDDLGSDSLFPAKNYAIDAAAGLQWAKQCRTAVELLVRDGSCGACELCLHPLVFESAVIEAAAEFEDTLGVYSRWGPESIACVQIMAEAYIRGALRDSLAMQMVGGRSWKHDTDRRTSELIEGPLIMGSDLRLASKLRGDVRFTL